MVYQVFSDEMAVGVDERQESGYVEWPVLEVEGAQEAEGAGQELLCATMKQTPTVRPCTSVTAYACMLVNTI